MDATTAYSYNFLDQLVGVSDALGNGVTVSHQYWGVEYQPGGNPSGHFGMVRSIAAGSFQGLTYDYDSRGNVSSLQDAVVGETISFAYDHLDRLLSAASALFNESYGYTKIGTFVSKGGVSYTYPSGGQPRPHAPTQVGGNTYTYDNNGSLIDAEGRTYTYDVENRLAGISGDVTKGFTYDGDGVLRTSTEGGVTTRYVDGDYRVNVSTGEAFIYYRFLQPPNRLRLKGLMSMDVLPLSTSSAISRPVAGACIKPWPLNPLAQTNPST